MWKIYLAGTGWATIFGLSFLVVKGALEAFTPFELLFLRFALATVFLAGLALLGVIKLDYRGKPRLALAAVCLFQPLLYFTFETYGLRETASSTAALILGSLPAAVAAISVPLLGERLTRRQTIGLLASIAGVALIVYDGELRSGGAGQGTDSLRGILLIIGALLSAAFYNVYSRRASARYSPMETTFAMMASGALVFGVLALGGLVGGGRPAATAAPGPAVWGAVAYLGLLSSVLAFFLLNFSLSRLKATQSSIFSTLITFVALAAGVAFRGETLGPVEALGAVAIVAGVWATTAMTDLEPRRSGRSAAAAAALDPEAGNI
jgi:drug/metabolite transporter (DMT)-like permease